MGSPVESKACAINSGWDAEMMKASDTIVACGGWFRRDIRFKPFHLLAGVAALASGMFTGVVGSVTAYVWLHDKAVPETFLVRSAGLGLLITPVLIGVTSLIGKKEWERKITVLEANRKTDPRCLY
jgi:hypothetical protein